MSTTKIICKSILAPAFLLLLGMMFAVPAGAVTVTAEAWNTIGLDSNDVTVGPNHFPVGARVCGGTPGATDSATLTWDTASGPAALATYDNSGAYIYLRPGSANPVSFIYRADGCADAYFEVEVNRTTAAYDMKRRYHITAGGVSTTTPRELYVEHLVSQSRNGVTDIKVGPVGGPVASVAAGGSMNLVVGNSYDIELDSFTATQGYSQLESYINFSNVVFQILNVKTTYSVVSANSGGVTSPNSYLYSDACLWDNDPNSPTYRSCLGSGNAGGTITTTYSVKILSGGGTSMVLNSLAHDFSGSSFHYNADYSVSARYGNIIDPTAVTIAKSFSPGTTNAGGVATLTFTLTNPNAGAISGLNFIDVFPTSPGAMTLNDTVTANTCGGTLTNNLGGALAAGKVGIKLAGGTVPANSSCMVQVDVTPAATGTYTNTTNHLFVDALDTGKFATASLTVNTTPPPPPLSNAACAAPVTLATWTMPTSGQGSGGPPPPYTTIAANVSSATASFVGSSQSIVAGATTNAWGGVSTGASGWTETATSMTNYFQFTLDTSNYGTVKVTYDGNPTSAGNWGNPTSNVFINTSANGGAYSAITPVQTAGKNAWTTGLTSTAAATGTSTTTFRFGVDGASKPAATFLLDNVVFTGCTRPLANLLAITKSFATNPVAVNGTSVLTFTVTNNNATSTAPLTGISFTDVLPLSALQGTVAVTNGSPTVTGTGSTFSTQLAPGSNVSIGGGSYTVLSITSNTSLTLTANYAGATAGGISMSAGQTVASPLTTTNTCGGTVQNSAAGVLTAGNAGVLLSGVTLAPLASCTVSVLVKDNVAGALENVSGFISSNETGSNTSSTGVAKATLTAVLPPTISKRFAPNPILANGVATLSFTVTNPNQNDALGGVAFTDTFPVAPGAMVVAATPTATISGCGTPTYAPVAGAASVTFSGGTIAPAGTCTVTVNVTAATLGSYINTSGAVSATTAGTGNTATATLTVSPPHPAISLFKEVASTNTASTIWNYYLAVPTGGNVYYQFQVQNDGDVPMSSVSVVDNPQAGDLPVSLAGCVWHDGDGLVLTAPFTLQVASNANNKDFATCIIGPFAAVAGLHKNTAKADSIYSVTGTHYTATDWAQYATTGLTIAKSATQSYFTAAGNVLNYSYVVQNTGSATLQGPVTVTDNKTTVTCPAVSTATLTASLPSIVLGDGDNWLDPGEQITCTASYTVLAADVTAKLVTNIAYGTVSGVNTANATLTIPLAPDLAAIKTNNVSGTLAVGGLFNWTLTATNSSAAGTATFASGQTLLTDDLPATGATYVLGAVSKSGVTGTGAISCAIASNTLTCTASGGTVILPGGLQGTISVTNGSAAVTGVGTSFTTQLAAGSVIAISGVPYTVASIASDTSLTLTANYAAATATGIAVPGSFSVLVAVTTTATGSLVNPRSGGACGVDPAAAIAEINKTNNSCANTVTVNALPSITLLKTVAVSWDPVNLLVNPKLIPGAIAQYSIIASNSGGAADNNSIFVTDPVPANTLLFVNDIGVAGSGPVLFSQGTTSSTLSYTFTTLNSTTDDLSFSNDNGVTWTAVPTFNATTGCDTTAPAITHIRINPKGTFVGNPTAPSPSFQLFFRVCVQ